MGMNTTINNDWADYALLDSGGFEKLERYGAYVLRRPEPQAVWPKRLTEEAWIHQAHAWFKRQKVQATGESGERGEWLLKPGMPDRWTVSYEGLGKPLRFRLAMTAFKHIGLFPEQVDNWRFVHQKTQALNMADPAVLNLFAYTGGASLAAAAAGALVTHVDAVKPVINWARENAEASGFTNLRWMVEDALKFVLRETRRGKRYQGIILDPPAYGRGPTGEKWVLEAQINQLLDACADLLDPGGFVLLNLYSMGFSPIIAANLLHQYFDKPLSAIEFGELTVTDEAGLVLPLSVFARF